MQALEAGGSSWLPSRRRQPRQESLPVEDLDSNGLRVVSLNLGGRNTNPVEFELKGDNSEVAVEAMAMLRRAQRALRSAQEGPRLMPANEVAVIKEILSEIYGGIDCEWRSRMESWLGCDTWGGVISNVQEKNSYLFNSLNLYTLTLKRPSVWEDPSSCLNLTTVTDYLLAWKQWLCALDRAGKFWAEEGPRAAKKRGLDMATALAGLLLYDVMCVCTARCAGNTGGHDAADFSEEEREVPFDALARFALRLPASSLTARHAVAQSFTAGAHVVLAQEARNFAEHPAIAESYLPPFCALDGFTSVFLRKTSFAEASNISTVLAEKMVERIRSDAPEDWKKAWRTTASRLAAVVCRCTPRLGGSRACFVSLHCSKSGATTAFLEALREALADYDADLHVVGMDANCAGDASAFQRTLWKLGFDFGCQPQGQQVTVAKQRTAFQTQVEKYGEIDISHKDYIVSWVSRRVRRGSTSYTPDLRTAYGVEQETKQCMRLPTTVWPFDHCGVTTTFERKVRRRDRVRCSLRSSLSCALAAFMILVLATPLLSSRRAERRSPYGEAGSWYYSSRPLRERVGVCEAAAPCKEGWISFGGSCYRATVRSSYSDVVQTCNKMSSTLVSLGSEAENLFVTSTLCPEGEFCYIGLRGDFTGEGHGEPVNYTRLVPARKSSLPLFPLSRRSEYQAGILSNLPEEVTGCDAEFIVPYNQGTWPLSQAVLPGIAMVVSGGLLILPRPAQQRFSTRLLWFAFAKNFVGLVPRIWLMCYEDDFSRLISIFTTTIVVETFMHSVATMLALWLIIKRLGMLYPSRALRTIFFAVLILLVLGYVNTCLFVDNSAEMRPSLPVLLQGGVAAVITVLSFLLTGMISADLYRAWSFLDREAVVGLSSQGGTNLTNGVRAARLHFFSALLASGSSALRWAAVLWLSLATMLDSYPHWVHVPLYFFACLDTVTNDVCVQLLAVLNMDASVVRAKGITIEVSERASQEVEQHHLAVRLLKAAPTSSEQLLELARLEGQARASRDTTSERQDFAVLKSAVRAEAVRIHRLMQCVRMRSMTMPLRYQYLLEIPVVDGSPRQPVPAKFRGDASDAAASAYFEWLYQEATGAQETFFNQLKQLLTNFNGTPWSSDLGLAREEFPWTIWAAGPKEVASRRLVEGDDISPGDILVHCPPRASCSAARGTGTLCVVLETISPSSVRIHRSGAASPEEVARGELRTCNSGAVFVPGPQKKKARCLDKISADYEGEEPWPAAASLVDICRCTILLDDPYAIAVLVAYIRKNMDVVRLKNRFSEDVLDTCDPKELQSMFHNAVAATSEGSDSFPDTASSTSTVCSTDNQYRDVSMNVAIATRAGAPLICEVQLTLSNLAILKHAEQRLYTVRRMKAPAELLKAHVFAAED